MSAATRILAGVVALLACGACSAEQSTLDDAIRDYVDTRHAWARQSCSCYELFVDASAPSPAPFASEQDCLAAYPAPTPAALSCIEAVLAEGPYQEAGNVELMECYVEVIRAEMDCFADTVAGACSASAMATCTSPGGASYELCGQALSSDQAEAIIHCSLE